nr:NADH dehydrogenase subunit 4L [Chelopistes texanus]
MIEILAFIFILGLFKVLISSSMMSILISLELMVVSLFSLFSFVGGLSASIYLLILFVVFSVIEGILGLSIMISCNFKNYSLWSESSFSLIH